MTERYGVTLDSPIKGGREFQLSGPVVLLQDALDYKESYSFPPSTELQFIFMRNKNSFAITMDAAFENDWEIEISKPIYRKEYLMPFSFQLTCIFC